MVCVCTCVHACAYVHVCVCLLTHVNITTLFFYHVVPEIELRGSGFVTRSSTSTG